MSAGDGLNVSGVVARPIIARPLPNQSSRTRITSPPVPVHTSNGMDIHRQYNRGTTTTISEDPRNHVTNGHGLLCTRHTRPAGATTPVQEAPLDLTKPLDLSSKCNRLQPPNNRTHNYVISSNKCHQHHQKTQHVSAGAANGRLVKPAVIAPYNFTNEHDVSNERAKNCLSRRAGLLASSPRNYNYKGRAVVIPRKEHVSESARDVYHQHNKPEQTHSMATNHGHHHNSMQHHSVPYTNVHSTPSQQVHHYQSDPTSSSSRGGQSNLPPPYPSQNRAGQQRVVHQDLRHRQILPKPSAAVVAAARPVLGPSISVNGVSGTIHTGQQQSRIAHVTALGYGTSNYTPVVSSAHSSGAHEATEEPMEHSNLVPEYRSRSATNLCPNSLSSGAIPTHNHEQKISHPHSVSPMRPVRTTCSNTKEIDNRPQNIPVLKLLESSIIAAAKLNQLLKPIDGSDGPSFYSANRFIADAPLKQPESNDSCSSRGRPLVATYSEPLCVDIPDQRQSSNIPPNLAKVFTNDRVLAVTANPQVVDYPLDSRLYRHPPSSRHQLSPPATHINQHDRISPTMPVLVPHKMYSPLELTSPSGGDPPLPILKSAEHEQYTSMQAAEPTVNPYTLPYLSPGTVDSKKVHSVSPVVTDMRHIESSQGDSYARQTMSHQELASAAAGRIASQGDGPREFIHHTRRQLDEMLRQLDCKNVTSSPVERPSQCTVTSSGMPNATVTPYVKHASFVCQRATRAPRTREEDREIFRKMVLQQRLIKRQELETKKKIRDFFYQEPEHTESEPEITELHVPPKKEPDIVDLTSSPEPSPTEVKPEVNGDVDDDVITVNQQDLAMANESSRQEFVANCIYPLAEKHVNLSDSDKSPRDVLGDLLTLKEASASKSSQPRVTCTTVQTATNVTSIHDSECERGRKISLILNSEMPTPSADEEKSAKLSLNTELPTDSPKDKGKSAKSYCQRHRRMLFSTPSRPQGEETATEVVNCVHDDDETRLGNANTTLGEVINYHFVSHDPRKKHLATLTNICHTPLSSTTGLVLPSATAAATDSANDPSIGFPVLPETNEESANSSTADAPPSPVSTCCPSPTQTPSREDSDERPLPPRKASSLEINRIANTSSYVADIPKKPKTGDLLVDSSLLDREERALQVDTGSGRVLSPVEESKPLDPVSSQRAMLRFSEMEHEAKFGVSNHGNHCNLGTQDVTEPKVPVEPKKRGRGRPPRRRKKGLNRAKKLMKVGRRRFGWKLGCLRNKCTIQPRGQTLKLKTARSKCTEEEPIADEAVEDEKSPTTETSEGPKCPIFGNRQSDSAPPNTFDENGTRVRRKRTPYHKNQRYELEIEKEEAKLVERKRKRTVSYESAPGDITDDSTSFTTPQPVIKRRRGRPKKSDGTDKLTKKIMKIKYKGVGSGNYPRIKKRKLRPKFDDESSNDVFTSGLTTPTTKSVKCSSGSSDQSVTSPVSKIGGLQRPLQVVIDPDNLTKMKFMPMSQHPPRSSLTKSLLLRRDNNKTTTRPSLAKSGGKRKRKTKHIEGNDENIDDVYTFKPDCDGDDDVDNRLCAFSKRRIDGGKFDQEVCLNHKQIKQEPADLRCELDAAVTNHPLNVHSGSEVATIDPIDDDLNCLQTEKRSNQPPPVQIVRPEPPIELKRIICNKKLGETVLHRACRVSKDEVAIYCIDYKMSDLNAKDNAGYTPLHECCVNGRVQIAEHLLRHGADANVCAADGTRPIHDAVDNHHIEIVRLLLAFGADPLNATYSGRTALTLARNKQIRAFLIGYLRDVNGRYDVAEDEYPEFLDAEEDSSWRFPVAPFSLSDSQGTNCPDVFLDIPDVASDDGMLFELSDVPHLPTYNLELAEDNGPKNWLLLNDVKQLIGGKLDDVINTRDDVKPITITRREFNYALKEGITSLTNDLAPKDHGHISDSDGVELLELNDALRYALGNEVEFIK